jgi:hypothetical protein
MHIPLDALDHCFRNVMRIPSQIEIILLFIDAVTNFIDYSVTRLIAI